MAYWCNTATYGVIGLGPRSAAVKCLQRLRRSAAEEGCGKDQLVHLVLWWSRAALLRGTSSLAARRTVELTRRFECGRCGVVTHRQSESVALPCLLRSRRIRTRPPVRAVVHGSAQTGLRRAGQVRIVRVRETGLGQQRFSLTNARALGRCVVSVLAALRYSTCGSALRETRTIYGLYALNSAGDAAPPFARRAASARRATPHNPRATRGKQLRNAQ
jgi:hypothetical protein